MNRDNHKSAIIIGASSGIGREMARCLSRDGYAVGLAARRLDLLEQLQAELPNPAHVKRIDISIADEAMRLLQELINEIGHVDLIVVSSGIGHVNPDLVFALEQETVDVNVTGFTAMINVGFKHFLSVGSGHLVGISSIAALRGAGEAPAYNASKAYVSNYLQGLRQKAAKSGTEITVTDIQAGLVDTDMAKGDGLFWVMPADVAARQIYSAVRKKRKHAYVTRRWRLIAWLIKILPDWIYFKL